MGEQQLLSAASTRSGLGYSPLVGDEVGDGRAVAVSQAGGFERVRADAVPGHERTLSAVAWAALEAKIRYRGHGETASGDIS